MQKFLKIDDWEGSNKDPRIIIKSISFFPPKKDGLKQFSVIIDSLGYLRNHDKSPIYLIYVKSEIIMGIMLMEVPQELYVPNSDYVAGKRNYIAGDDAHEQWIGSFYNCRITHYSEQQDNTVYVSFSYSHSLANVSIKTKKK